MAIKAFLSGLVSLSLALGPTGCIRPAYYRVGSAPADLVFDAHDSRYGQNYFSDGRAYEAYVEFNQRGALYYDQNGRDIQLEQALDLIRRCRFRLVRDATSCPEPGSALSGSPKPIALYIFIHGWKNNASESTSNPWGFRRFLSFASHRHPHVPVVGVYIGWPGASLKDDVFLTFWDREPIADIVGNSNDLLVSLRRLLHQAKGELTPNDATGPQSLDPASAFTSSDPSTAIVIGHSFGGIVLEHAATALLQETFDALRPGNLQAPMVNIQPPADLFVLVNEAGAASIAKPFLDRLQVAGVQYQCSMPVTTPGLAISDERRTEPCPLILSMTSEGDLATKFAYPAGEFLSLNRPPTQKFPLDRWGQTSSLPYNLITAANFIALQNHQIDQVTNVGDCFVAIPVQGNASKSWCMQTAPGLNTTPYWLMQLPQFFVPDHGTVFQPSFLALLDRAARGESFHLTVPATSVREMQLR